MLVFGPACGFILGSFCTKIYVDAVFIDTSKLDITPDDPRWIGAWWAGFLLCGALLFFSSLPMFGFPQSLTRRPEHVAEVEEAMLPEGDYERPKPSNGILPPHSMEADDDPSCFQQLRVIPKVTKHLLSNPVFTCIVLAACMEIAVVAGFAAFLGKYLEQQFNLTTSSANQLLGMTAIPCACLGIFLGGLLVKKLSLSALGAIQMAMLVSLVSTACYVSFLFLGCDTGPVAGITVPYGNKSTISSLAPYSACNSNCKCQMDSFTPVCGADGITYLSACFAGCTNMITTQVSYAVVSSWSKAVVSLKAEESHRLHMPHLGPCRGCHGHSWEVPQPWMPRSLPDIPVRDVRLQHDWSHGSNTLRHHPHQNCEPGAQVIRFRSSLPSPTIVRLYPTSPDLWSRN
ncbi:solute carrier organic anion transporter family member 3A1 isoform X3 [Python bivittatus]|uniref:Solute carrier organic anion transporter family member 3A1 isoform X3 n=1 Tax=Python bivittatus TaxID=176946 RepID=A0A9F5JD71_PYTBI|nr:solute carrier organic anion transporter family member 3A1 isoform X3 [Python bivittatus]